MHAPTCRTCGVSEYGHTCKGALKKAKALAKQKPEVKPKQQFSTGKRAR